MQGLIKLQSTHKTFLRAATRCNTHAATLCIRRMYLRRARCNMLQHAATRCNTLHHAATRYDTLQHNLERCIQRMPLFGVHLRYKVHKLTWCAPQIQSILSHLCTSLCTSSLCTASLSLSLPLPPSHFAFIFSASLGRKMQLSFPPLETDNCNREKRQLHFLSKSTMVSLSLSLSLSLSQNKQAPWLKQRGGKEHPVPQV